MNPGREANTPASVKLDGVAYNTGNDVSMLSRAAALARSSGSSSSGVDDVVAGFVLFFFNI